MTKLWALLAILLTFTLTLETAHAKRMGSGKSFGKSYQTTPAPDRARADNTPQRQQAAAAPAPAHRSCPSGPRSRRSWTPSCRSDC